jgi:KUP system potassium uptake protein
MTPYPGEVPAALLHNLKHNKVLHEKNVIMTVRIEDTPWVDPGERASLEELPDGFARATLRFGYMEAPDVPNAIPSCRRKGFRFDPMKTSYFVSRRTLRASARSRMPAWQDRMFVALSRTALDSARHFRLPPDRAVEIGMTVEI